jgi:GTP-binding protein Era
VDTPGFLKPQTPLEVILKKNTNQAINGADVILIIVDISAKSQKASFNLIDNILKKFHTQKTKFILAFNKIDKIKRLQIAEKAFPFQKYSEIFEFFMISAETGEKIDELKTGIINAIPTQEWMYQQKQELDFKQISAELTMEQIFKHLGKEIPYKTYVEPLILKEENDVLHIFENIIVSKESQKAIVVGHAGQMLKSIGRAARLDISKSLKHPIFLHLFVKVVKNWEKNIDILKRNGLR